jgi:hypothetical protein
MHPFWNWLVEVSIIKVRTGYAKISNQINLMKNDYFSLLVFPTVGCSEYDDLPRLFAYGFKFCFIILLRLELLCSNKFGGNGAGTKNYLAPRIHQHFSRIHFRLVEIKKILNHFCVSHSHVSYHLTNYDVI